MTLKKFFYMMFVQLILLTLLKVWFFGHLTLSNTGFKNLLYWAFIIIITAGTVRRLGVMNYLEAFLVAGVWFFTGLFIDLIFTSVFTSLGIFYLWQFWTGYFIMVLVISAAHKKRHIEIRKELRAKHDRGH